MLLSIVIPCLNEADNIAATLTAIQKGFVYANNNSDESARLELKNNLEIILVDGGSSDKTVDIARSYVDAVIASEAGRSTQMNAGGQVAKGEVLLFLHADTLLPKEFLQILRDDFLPSDKCWGRFDVQLSGQGFVLRVVEAFINGKSRLSSVATGDQAIFVKRETFLNVGAFDSIPLMEDVAISKKLRKISLPYNVDERVVTSSRRWQKNGSLKVILQMWLIRFAFWIGVNPLTLHKWYYPKS